MKPETTTVVLEHRITDAEALSIPDGSARTDYAAITLPPVTMMPGGVPGPDGSVLPALQVTVLLPPGMVQTSRLASGPPFNPAVFGGCAVRVILRREHLLEAVQKSLAAADAAEAQAPRPQPGGMALDLSRFLDS